MKRAGQMIQGDYAYKGARLGLPGVYMVKPNLQWDVFCRWGGALMYEGYSEKAQELGSLQAL